MLIRLIVLSALLTMLATAWALGFAFTYTWRGAL